MKTLSVVATTLLLLTIAAPLATPAAAADDVAVSPAASSVKESVVVDCSKEVWPDFSPSCLRNSNGTVVRLVTVNRRQITSLLETLKAKKTGEAGAISSSISIFDDRLRVHFVIVQQRNLAVRWGLDSAPVSSNK